MSSRRQSITPTTEREFNKSDSLGVSRESARRDHTHGTPDNPVNVVDVGALIAAATEKTTPVNADYIGLVDSAAGNVLKKLSWSNVKITLKAYFDTLYPLVAGKAGGQTINGGTASGENLTLHSTAHATKGKINFGANSAYDQANDRIGIGTTTPTAALHLKAGTATANTAPIKLTSGSLNTVAEAGAVEFLTDEFYGTVTTGAARKKFAQLDKTLTGRLQVPMGEVNYFSTTGTAISITAQSDGSTNMVVVNPATALSTGVSECDNGGANNGRVRYTGATTKMFHVAVTISFSPESANDEFVIGVAKNGTVIPASKVIQKSRGIGETSSTALHIMAELATNDYIELYAGNLNTTGDFTIKTMTTFVMGM